MTDYTEMELEKDIWLQNSICPNCRAETNYYLKKYKYKVTFGFIPFMSITKKYVVGCAHCDANREITKAEYKALKKEQKRRLKNLEFPTDVVANDYAPKNTGFIKKLIWFIITLVLAMMWTSLEVSIGLENDFGAFDYIVMFLILSGIPLAISTPSFISALKKLLIYKQYEKAYCNLSQ